MGLCNGSVGIFKILVEPEFAGASLRVKRYFALLDCASNKTILVSSRSIGNVVLKGKPEILEGLQVPRKAKDLTSIRGCSDPIFAPITPIKISSRASWIWI